MIVEPLDAPAVQIKRTLPSPEAAASLVPVITGAAGVPAGADEVIALSPLPAAVTARTLK